MSSPTTKCGDATADATTEAAHDRSWNPGPLRVPLELAGVMLAVAFLLRLVLVVAHVDRSALSLGAFVRVFATGLRFDSLISLACVAPMMGYIAVCGARRVRFATHRRILEAAWSIVFVVLPLLCVAEYLFFDEFDSRLNYIAFEYLVYPTEVCCNIQQSYPVGTLLAGVALSAGGLCFAFRSRWNQCLQRPLSSRTRGAAPAALLAVLAALGVTSDAADTQVCENRVANECAANGVFSFLYHAWTCRFEFDRLYVTTSADDAHARVRRQFGRPGDHYVAGAANPLDRVVTTGRSQRDYNVVLILEESLGADFIGALGRKKTLTPHFDALTRDGILFDNFYSTGNRTARALEAVLTSLPPLPTESILKRDHSDHVDTLANVLADRGYERLFMTGGRGSFDGVRRFMKTNGFNHFREQKDYRDPAFTNAWGVSDEDLFGDAARELDSLAARDSPFFATILTVSNHKPFTFPDGRVDVPSSRQYREFAVMYADWALGDFFRKIHDKPWYDDTLFIVMGDHGARIYGRQLMPLESYRIPVLMILPGGTDAGTRCSTLGCSLDIAPTILGALGGNYASVFFGRDVRSLRPDEGFAVMQHNHTLGLLNAKNELTVLDAGRRSSQFVVDRQSFQLHETGLPSNESAMNIVSIFQTAYEMYYGDKCYPSSPRLRSTAVESPAHGAGTSEPLAASHR